LRTRLITYCPDTRYYDNAVKLSRKADLLIAECTYKRGQQSSEWPHLNPEEAAKLAVKVSAKSLALVHFDAYIYQTLEDRRIAEKQAQGIFNNTFAAMDDMQIEV
jgi:ribonuclease BN (tRNA processing enzyme)